MKTFNSYWPIYKNLEEEILQLTKYINFSDDQLKVYSMHIADLIMRIVVEIESLAKELYITNGGPNVFDNEGNSRNLFFDTDCINYLNTHWGICNRDIIISCTNFNFSDEQYKTFKPLKKANRSGDRSAKWIKAYQSVKHDRRNNLKKGNIENLIQALGALYILNIYYKDEMLEYGVTNSSNIFLDNRLGSDIFAASFADASKVSISLDDSDNAIDKEEIEKKDSAIYIIKYRDEDWKKMHEEFLRYNNEIREGVMQGQKFKEKLNKITTDANENTLDVVKSLIEKMQIEYVRKNPPINFGRMISNGKKEVILNKGQNIYKT